MYNGWKTGKFVDLVTDEMELVAQQMLKRIMKVCREIKVGFAPDEDQFALILI